MKNIKSEKIILLFILIFSLFASLILVIIFSLTDSTNSFKEFSKNKINYTSGKNDSLNYYYYFCKNTCKNNTYYIDCDKICYNLVKNYKEDELKDKIKSDCFKESFIKLLEKGECNNNCLECKRLNNCELSLEWCEGGYN